MTLNKENFKASHQAMSHKEFNEAWDFRKGAYEKMIDEVYSS